jgi:hypothetical protein
MRNQENYDISNPRPASGVSPAWQVVAVLAIFAAAGLLVIAGALGLGLFVALEKPAANNYSRPAVATIVGPAAAAAGEEDDDEEPANPRLIRSTPI